jgi:hypothetical protein
MITNTINIDHSIDHKGIDKKLENRVADNYRSQGYEVIHSPNVNEIPFDLDNYCPDLLVKTSASRGLIIEIEDVATNLAIERYSKIAKAISEYGDWRFLLITSEDATPIAEEDIADDRLTRPQILKRKERIAKLMSIGDREAAFFSLWIFAEILMRRHARQVFIPIDRLPTILMINHLYDQAEIPLDQFDRLISLMEIRNRIAHGFLVKPLSLNEAIEKLLVLVDEFISMEK